MAEKLEYPSEELLPNSSADSGSGALFGYSNPTGADPLAGSEATQFLQDNPPGSVAGEITSLSGSESTREGLQAQFQTLLGEHQAGVQKGVEAERATAAAEKPDIEALRAQLSKTDPTYKEAVTDQEPPRPKMPQPVGPEEFQKFSGMALLMAALAGRASKAPLTASLNAFSGAISGYYKGDEEKYKRSMAEYEVHMKEALDRHKELVDAYKANLEEKNLTSAQLMEKLKLTAMEHQHDTMIAQLETGGALEGAKLVAMMDKSYTAMTNYSMRFSKQTFGMVDKIRGEMNKAMVPVNKTQDQITNIRNLLQTGGPTATSQIQKELTLLRSNLRSGQHLYDANSSFGMWYERVTNKLSRGYFGEYSDENKKEIHQMMDSIEANVLTPEKQQILNYYQKAGEPFGVDPKWIESPDFYKVTPPVNAVKPGASGGFKVISVQ